MVDKDIKKRKKDCQKLIDERKLQYSFIRISGTNFLKQHTDEDNNPVRAIPVLSWNDIYETLVGLPYEKEEEKAVEREVVSNEQE